MMGAFHVSVVRFVGKSERSILALFCVMARVKFRSELDDAIFVEIDHVGKGNQVIALCNPHLRLYLL